MSLFQERHWPVAVAFLVAATLYIVCFSWSIEIDFLSDSVLSAGITVGALFVGFDSFHKSTIIGVQSALMRKIAETGYKDVLFSYITDSLFISLGFVIWSGILMCLPDVIPCELSCSWVFSGLWMMFAFIRVHLNFNKIYMSQLNHNAKSRSNTSSEE